MTTALLNSGLPILEFEGVCQGGVLSNVTFSIYSGRVTGLAGLSAEEKRVLLRILLGRSGVDSGTIHETYAMPTNRAVTGRPTIRYVSAVSPCIPVWAAEPYLRAKSVWQGISQRRVTSVIKAVEFETHSSPHMWRLSALQSLQISLADAILARPQICVVDMERVPELCVRHGWMARLCRDLARQGAGVVLMLSDESRLTPAFAEDVVLFRHGSVIHEGSVNQCQSWNRP